MKKVKKEKAKRENKGRSNEKARHIFYRATGEGKVHKQKRKLTGRIVNRKYKLHEDTNIKN